MSENEIINRVELSPLITLNLEDHYHPGERVLFDIKDNLDQGLILREKDFRQFVRTNDWSQYKNKNVALICSTDAIVPVWAYMLLTAKMTPFVNLIIQGDLEQLEQALFYQSLDQIDFQKYLDKKVVVKGCGDLPIPDLAYVEVTRRLLPYVSSIMYGEPCSTVPIYKRSKGGS